LIDQFKNALFFILLLSTTVLSTKEENILELVDQSPEGRDILNNIFLELESTGPTLDRGSLFKLLKTTKQNTDKKAAQRKTVMKKQHKSCVNDLKILSKQRNENERHQYTVQRHVNSNKHAQSKNNQYLSRSKEEFNGYDALRNLVMNNRKNWVAFLETSRGNIRKIMEIGRSVVVLLRHAHAAAHAAAHAKKTPQKKPVAQGKKAFIELKDEFFKSLSELRVEFANTNDTQDGLKPIISSLLETLAEPNHAGKAQVRGRVIKILKGIGKLLRGSLEFIDTLIEGSNAYFDALLRNLEENKTRVQKLQQRLSNESTSLEARRQALGDGLTRASNITALSGNALRERRMQCRNIQMRHAHLKVSTQKIRNIVAQLEEILSERFGNLKSYFIERKMKLEAD